MKNGIHRSSNSGSSVHTLSQIVLNCQKYAEGCLIEHIYNKGTLGIVNGKQMTLDFGYSFLFKIPILPDQEDVDP